MFLAHRPGMPARAVENEADAHGVTWLDLLNPTPQEQALATALCGQPIPTFDDLNEIESSSRISVRNGAAFCPPPAQKNWHRVSDLARRVHSYSGAADHHPLSGLSLI